MAVGTAKIIPYSQFYKKIISYFYSYIRPKWAQKGRPKMGPSAIAAVRCKKTPDGDCEVCGGRFLIGFVRTGKRLGC